MKIEVSFDKSQEKNLTKDTSTWKVHAFFYPLDRYFSC